MVWGNPAIGTTCSFRGKATLRRDLGSPCGVRTGGENATARMAYSSAMRRGHLEIAPKGTDLHNLPLTDQSTMQFISGSGPRANAFVVGRIRGRGKVPVGHLSASNSWGPAPGDRGSVSLPHVPRSTDSHEDANKCTGTNRIRSSAVPPVSAR